MRFGRIINIILCLLCLTGCSQTEASRLSLCQVALEEGDGFSCADSARTVEPGADVSFYLTCDIGFTVTGADYNGYTLIGRNAPAISEDSTPDARAALDAYLQENLYVPIITGPEDSLWPGACLYGTDNHLSTEGVEIHTDRIIAVLKAWFAAEEAALEAHPSAEETEGGS